MPSPLDAALTWLTTQQRAMEGLLAELVDLSSHTPDTAGVTAVAERYAAALDALGRGALATQLLPSTSGRFGAHLVAATAAAGPPTLLVGHHDTVFPRAHFAGFREDGALLRGPGVLDMKGGLVVIGFALGALAEAGLLERTPVRVISVADEEVGSPEGASILREHCAGARAALVFESGRAEDKIITRRKGTGAATVRARGRAAHAGNAHQDGANAIWALARFVDRAQALTDYDRGITINVGKIGGGIGKNTVPDAAEALLDFRFISMADGRTVEHALAAAAREAAATLPGTTLEVDGGIARLPLERTAASAALAASYGVCAALAGLGQGEAALLGGGSDANTAAAAGVPAIDGLGPRGKGFHTVDEMIERATLVPKAAALVRYLAG